MIINTYRGDVKQIFLFSYKSKRKLKEEYENSYGLNSHEISKYFIGEVEIENVINKDKGIATLVFSEESSLYRVQRGWGGNMCEYCHNNMGGGNGGIDGDIDLGDLDEVVITDPGDDDWNNDIYDEIEDVYNNGPIGGGISNPDNSFDEKIDESQLSPCMKQILNTLRNQNSGSVTDIINQFSGNNPGFNWKVVDGSLSGQTGSTSTSYDYVNEMVTTTFDSQAWPNATDLSWARTILHESIHAYVVSVTYNSNLSQSEKQILFGPDWATVYLNQGHTYIANNYITPIADALEQYGIQQGYNLNRQFYEDMAWGGLQGTTAFNSLSSADRQRISDNLAIELTGNDLNNQSQNQNGNNAGC